MNYTYTVLKAEYVFDNLALGKTVLCIDFKSMRVMDCSSLLVSAVQAFIENGDAVFYKREEATS